MACKSIWDLPEDSNLVQDNSNLVSFKEMKLNEYFLKALVDEKFDAPNQVQKSVIEHFNIELQAPYQVQKNMIEYFNRASQTLFVYAPCRSGKTSAILIAMINKLLKITIHGGPYVVIIYPSNDLAKNAYNLAERLTKYCPRIKVDLVVNKRELKNKLDKVDILIGTPEKLQQLLKDNKFKSTQFFVIDEADNILNEKGYNKFLAIKNSLPSACNVILSYASKTKHIEKFIEDNRYTSKVIEIQLEKHEMSLVDQVYVVCNNMQEKVRVVLSGNDIYPGQTLIVCDTKEELDNVVEAFKDMGIHIHALYKALAQTQRTEIIKQFESGYIPMLLITPYFLNLISFNYVSMMFNFDQILDQTTHYLNLEVYKKRESLLKGKKSLIVNLVEKLWERHLFKGSEEVNGKKVYKGLEVVYSENFLSFFDKP